MLCVSSSAKTIAVSGERIVPPIIAAMPISAQKPGSPTGTMPPNSAPSAPPMISSGASTPPDVPEPSATDQMIAFTSTSRTIAAGGHMRRCSSAAMMS